MLVNVMSYNPYRLYRDPEDSARFAQVEQVIQNVEPHILMVQELYAPDQEQAIESAERLATATGLACKLDNGPGLDPTYAVINGNKSNYAQAIMWRPDMQPVAESWRVVSPDKFWHGLGVMAFSLDGVKIYYANYHGTTRVKRDVRLVNNERIDEGELVSSVLTEDPGIGPYVLAAGDWNGQGTVIVDGLYYDPEGFDVELELDEESRWLGSQRTAGQIFLDHGLIDIAPALRVPRQPTVGHWPSSRYGNRRIDIFRVTRPLLKAVRKFVVIDTAETRSASDHLPILAQLETDELLST
jgi:hypothetical protein